MKDQATMAWRGATHTSHSPITKVNFKLLWKCAYNLSIHIFNCYFLFIYFYHEVWKQYVDPLLQTQLPSLLSFFCPITYPGFLPPSPQLVKVNFDIDEQCLRRSTWCSFICAWGDARTHSHPSLMSWGDVFCSFFTLLRFLTENWIVLIIIERWIFLGFFLPLSNPLKLLRMFLSFFLKRFDLQALLEPLPLSTKTLLHWSIVEFHMCLSYPCYSLIIDTLTEYYLFM